MSDVPPFERPGIAYTPLTDLPGLTTEYTFPSQCSSRWWFAVPVSGDPFLTTSGIYSGQTTALSEYVDPIYRACIPSADRNFSPGMCPSGQTLARVTEYQSGTDRYFEGPCCDKGFTYDTKYYWCRTFATDPIMVFLPSEVSVASPKSSCENIETETAAFRDEGCKNYTVVSSTYLNANYVSVKWKDSDIKLFPLSYQTYLASTALRGQGIEVSNELSSSMSSESGSSEVSRVHHISPGAIAGVVIGAVLATSLLILAIWLFLRRRRRNEKSSIVIAGFQAGAAEGDEQETKQFPEDEAHMKRATVVDDPSVDARGGWKAELDASQDRGLKSKPSILSELQGAEIRLQPAELESSP